MGWQTNGAPPAGYLRLRRLSCPGLRRSRSTANKWLCVVRSPAVVWV